MQGHLSPYKLIGDAINPMRPWIYIFHSNATRLQLLKVTNVTEILLNLQHICVLRKLLGF